MSILRRLPGERFSEILRGWPDATAVLIGGGPSLTLEQVELVRRARENGAVRVIAINDAYLLALWAEVQYAADSEWHGWHKVRPEFVAFAGQKCTIQNSGANVQDDAVHMLRDGGRDGLSADPRALRTGRHSGFQALNLAILAGATTVILLGFDGKPNAEGRTHFFGDHPRPEPFAVYEEMRKAFSAAETAIEAAGVTVVNCSPGSAIDSFPKMTLEVALAAHT